MDQPCPLHVNGLIRKLQKVQRLPCKKHRHIHSFLFSLTRRRRPPPTHAVAATPFPAHIDSMATSAVPTPPSLQSTACRDAASAPETLRPRSASAATDSLAADDSRDHLVQRVARLAPLYLLSRLYADPGRRARSCSTSAAAARPCPPATGVTSPADVSRVPTCHFFRK